MFRRGFLYAGLEGRAALPAEKIIDFVAGECVSQMREFAGNGVVTEPRKARDA